MTFMQTVQRAATLAMVGVAAGVVHSAIHEPLVLRPAEPLPMPTPAGQATSGAPAALGLEITLEQSWGLFQQGVSFIDARLSTDYEAGHVEGAFWIAPETFIGGMPEAINYLDRERQVVIYCTGGDCDASHNVAALLNQAGFKRCHIMKDGYPAWSKAGHPTATGKPGPGGTP